MEIETIKTIIRIISIICGVLIYAFIWYCYIKDKKIRETGYDYWCFERALSDFYFGWFTFHVITIFLIIIWTLLWAWGVI